MDSPSTNYVFLLCVWSGTAEKPLGFLVDLGVSGRAPSWKPQSQVLWSPRVSRRSVCAGSGSAGHRLKPQALGLHPGFPRCWVTFMAPSRSCRGRCEPGPGGRVALLLGLCRLWSLS